MKKKLPQDIVYKQIDKITDTIDKFVDKIGFSKNEWKKMLEIYK
jgi:tRNA nucleotidyltransferase (CCA-adding enzyme)